MTDYNLDMRSSRPIPQKPANNGLPPDSAIAWTSLIPNNRRSNEALDIPLSNAAQAAMIQQAQTKIAELFDVLQIDYANDHNTRGTPARVAKMLVQETLSGRYRATPAVTEFDNALGFHDLIVTGPIDLRSTCAHHMMPIVGHAYIGIIPSKDGKIIGLSKYDRIVHHFASRLQIQEELVKQISDYIMDKTSPDGLAVRISAVHMCKTHRGVNASPSSKMITTTFVGKIREEPNLREQFLRECNAIDGGALKCL